MQKSDSNQTAKTARRRVQSSTTLNRRYVKRPAKTTDIVADVVARTNAASNMTGVSVKRSPKVKHFGSIMSDQSTGAASMGAASMDSAKMPSQPEIQPQVHPMQVKANKQMKQRSISMASETAPAQAKPTAKELKDLAIQRALATAAKTGTTSDKTDKAKKSKAKQSSKLHFGFGRVMLALSCAAAAVFAIVYFVNLNMPDISLKVAAMQTGIEASYPSYVPRDFSLSDITSEEGKVTLNFKNNATGDSFSLVEEKSSWDSNALLTNYIKDAYEENYTVIKEQGLTLYVSGSDAAWVNGGVVYKLTTNSGTLTKKQIKSIATSL